MNNEAATATATATITVASRPVLHIDEVDKIYNPVQCQMQLRSVKLPAIKLSPIINVVDQLTDNLVRLPHTVSHRWRHVMVVIAQLAALSFVVHTVFLLTPVKPANAGYEANKLFIAVVVPHYQAMEIIPWIETVRFAIPENKGITTRARIAAILVGLGVQAVFDLAITHSFWTGAPKIFPIPFSVLTTGLLSGPAAMLTLFFMSSDRDETFRAKFILCQMVLAKYLISYLMGGLWAVMFGYLMGHWSQNLSAILFAVIKLVCKVVLFQKQMTLLNPHKWPIMNLVVDVIFARVQVVTLPFIQSSETLFILLASDLITILWKLYNGADRIGMIWSTFWDWIHGRTEKVDARKAVLGVTSLEMAANVLTAPLADVHTISIRLDAAMMEDDAQFSDWEEESAVNTDSDSYEMDSTDCDEECAHEHTDDITTDDGSIEVVGNPSTAECSNDDNVIKVSSTPSFPPTSHDQEEIDLELGVTNRSSHPRAYSCRPSLTSDDTSTDANGSISSRSLPSICLSVETIDLDDSGHTDSCSVDTNCSDNKSACHLEDSDSLEPSALQNGLTVSNRRTIFRLSRGNNNRGSNSKPSLLHEQVEEVTWEQRHLFNSVDTAASEVLTLIVEMHSMATMTMLRHLPIKQYLTAPFQIDDAQFEQAVLYSTIVMVFNALLLSLLALHLRYLRNPNNGQQVSLNGIMSYIFRDNFWFLCLWLNATGVMACSAMIQHFGADFSLKFVWLQCRETSAMAWPGCL